LAFRCVYVCFFYKFFCVSATPIRAVKNHGNTLVLCKTSFRQNRFCFFVVIQMTVETWNFHQIFILVFSRHDNIIIIYFLKHFAPYCDVWNFSLFILFSIFYEWYKFRFRLKYLVKQDSMTTKIIFTIIFHIVKIDNIRRNRAKL